MTRDIRQTADHAHAAAELAVCEWLSRHPGHGIESDAWQDIRGMVDRTVFDAAFACRKSLPFDEMLSLARSTAARLLRSCLDRAVGTTGQAQPVCPGGGDSPTPRNRSTPRQHGLAASTRVRGRGACLLHPRYRQEAIAAATGEGLVRALLSYDPARGPLDAWVMQCARFRALAVIRERTRADEHQHLNSSLESRGDGRSTRREFDTTMIAFVDEIAGQTLSRRQHGAYVRHRLDQQAGDENQRNALLQAKRRVRDALEQNGLHFEDFFLSA